MTTDKKCPHCGAGLISPYEFSCGSRICVAAEDCNCPACTEIRDGVFVVNQSHDCMNSCELTRLRSENARLKQRLGELRDLIRPYIKDEEDIISERQGYFPSTYQSWFRSLLARLREILLPASEAHNESEGV